MSWEDKTPAASVEAATKQAHEAHKHAREANQRTLEILASVHRIEDIGGKVLEPRQPRSRIERALMMAAAGAIVLYVLAQLAPKFALAMP